MPRPVAARSNVRVAILEDHELFAESLELVLTMEGYDVRRIPVPDGATTNALLTAVTRVQPLVVLLDLDLGGFGTSVPLVGPLARAGINVIVVTASADRAAWGLCLRHGARKVVSKTQPLQSTLSVVRRVHHGEPVLTVQEREELVGLWNEQRQRRETMRQRLDLLTQRERRVLGMLMEGKPVREIAREGFVSEATVRTQVKSVLAKLGVSSQLAAVGMAHEVGWRPPR